MTKPLVTILCIAYNQEAYIKEALDGFLIQQTNFPFEIIVHDDASTDRTAGIIREYAKQNPDTIIPWLEKENQFSKNNSGFVKKMYQAAKGKYVIACEGDDFWADAQKLQRQVDFMEEHPDYALCFHPAKVLYEKGDMPEETFPANIKKSNLNAIDLLKANYIFTNTVLYRVQNYDGIPDGIIPLDWYMHLYHARKGKIGYIDQVMSVYRRQETGVWQDAAKDIGKIWHKYGMAHFKMYIETLKLFEKQPAARSIMLGHIDDAFGHIIRADAQYHSQLLGQVVRAFPEETASYIGRQQAKANELDSKNQQVSQLEAELMDSATRLAQREHELAAIKRSRAWKLRNKLAGKTGRGVI